eukprot:NODE_261_length_11439_cov_1.285538.p10 type:complete len:188 gc:universal NODE_261_length_11439_cov_1.285538:9145-8582(-)
MLFTTVVIASATAIKNAADLAQRIYKEAIAKGLQVDEDLLDCLPQRGLDCFGNVEAMRDVLSVQESEIRAIATHLQIDQGKLSFEEQHYVCSAQRAFSHGDAPTGKEMIRKMKKRSLGECLGGCLGCLIVTGIAVGVWALFVIGVLVSLSPGLYGLSFHSGFAMAVVGAFLIGGGGGGIGVHTAHST